MDEDVLIQIIAAVGLIFSAAITSLGIIVVGIRRDTKVTREQVANNHVDEHGEPINLRDEQDARHAENTKAIAALGHEFRQSLRTAFTTLSRELDLVVELVKGNTDDIDRLENTHPTGNGRHRK